MTWRQSHEPEGVLEERIDRLNALMCTRSAIQRPRQLTALWKCFVGHPRATRERRALEVTTSPTSLLRRRARRDRSSNRACRGARAVAAVRSLRPLLVKAGHRAKAYGIIADPSVA